MATFVCRQYPTLVQFVPKLDRNVQLAHGQYVAKDEEEAEALRELIELGYFEAYETDEETDAANAILARKAAKAAADAEKRRAALPKQTKKQTQGQGQPGPEAGSGDANGDADTDADED